MDKKNTKPYIINLKSNKAFTLIELLVVVAIIGILSALLMSNFIGVRQRARDAQRKSDLRQIQSALELYRADAGKYPYGSNPFNPCGSNDHFKSADGSSTYMSSIPCDPSSGDYYTYSSSDGVTYTLIACLENGNDNQKDASNIAPCDGTTNFSYTVTNP